MKRKDFIKRAGTLGLGAGALALIRPTNVDGGVNDNADLRKTVGYADFSNLAPTLTEAVGNSTLETTAKTLSGGINELKKSVSDGKKLLADTITKNGVSTAGDATFKTMADNIDTIASNANSASADSYNKGYAQGVTDADNRANSASTNYKTGYNQGVTDTENNGGNCAIWLYGANSSLQGLYFDANCFTQSGNALYVKKYGTYHIATTGYTIGGNVNVNESNKYVGDISAYKGGYNVTLSPGQYIASNMNTGSSDGADGTVCIKKIS